MTSRYKLASSMTNRPQGLLPGGLTNPNITYLDDPEEQKFQNWYSNVSRETEKNPDPDEPLHHYDYRGAFTAGSTLDKNKHLPSTFKLEGHSRTFLRKKNGQIFNTKTNEIVPDVGQEVENE